MDRTNLALFPSQPVYFTVSLLDYVWKRKYMKHILHKYVTEIQNSFVHFTLIPS